MKKLSTYEGIAGKALAFMKGNFARQITIPEIAKATACSEVHLRRAFSVFFRETIVARLIHLRLEKARELLHKTDLAISEIAYEVGFSSYTCFAHTFRAKTGTAPGSFRRLARASGDVSGHGPVLELENKEKPWFSDLFNGATPDRWWKKHHGQWRTEKGYASLAGDELALLQFLTPLPENFRIVLEFQYCTGAKVQPRDLFMNLMDKGHDRQYCGFVVGAHCNTTGEYHRGHRTIQWDHKALIKPDEWQTAALEFRDDTVLFSLDKVSLFKFRDPFPPPYSSRCVFSFGTWRSALRIRKFAIIDLGFAATVSPIRQGDSLYNAEIWEQARDLYTRMLQSERSREYGTELRYKIAMCFLAEGTFSQARAWLGKVVTSPGTDFWAQQCELGMLQADWKQGNLNAFCGRLGKTLRWPYLHSEVRDIAERVVRQEREAGFWERCARLQELLVAFENGPAIPALLARRELANTYVQLNRFAECESLLEGIAGTRTVPPDIKEPCLTELSYAYCIHGKIEESEEAIALARVTDPRPSVLGVCACHHAYNLRALGRTDEALEALAGVKTEFPGDINSIALAGVHQAYIFCAQGKVALALQALEEAEKVFPGSPDLSATTKNLVYYIPDLVSGNYAASAEILRQGAEFQSNRISLRAGQMVRAGIVYELGGQAKDANRVWSRTIREFPPARCCFWADLARRLMEGEIDGVEYVPYHAQRRSEMAYLIALLWEKRGDQKRARQLLQFSVEEDPSRHWAAELARKKLLEK